ncbi:MAG: hypothetical protein ACYC1I_09310 [Acidimicrobiales bacterium]
MSVEINTTEKNGEAAILIRDADPAKSGILLVVPFSEVEDLLAQIASALDDPIAWNDGWENGGTWERPLPAR